VKKILLFLALMLVPFLRGAEQGSVLVVGGCKVFIKKERTKTTTPKPPMRATREELTHFKGVLYLDRGASPKDLSFDYSKSRTIGDLKRDFVETCHAVGIDIRALKIGCGGRRRRDLYKDDCSLGAIKEDKRIVFFAKRIYQLRNHNYEIRGRGLEGEIFVSGGEGGVVNIKISPHFCLFTEPDCFGCIIFR
jgi:hypothetical protein